MPKRRFDDSHFHNEDKARAYLERVRWPKGVVCPYCCSGKHISPYGPSMGPGWYRCTPCRRQFTVRVGTVFERSHIPLHKWLHGTYLMNSSKKGISAHQLGRVLGLSYKSAWFMAHRIREAMAEDGTSGPLGGGGKTVQADETLIGPGRAVFQSGRGWVGEQGTGGKMKVLSVVQPGGGVRSMAAKSISAKTAGAFITSVADPASVLHTDEARMYPRIGKAFAGHATVKHMIREFVRDGVTTNHVEGYFGVFKRGMRGTYQHCASHHLHRYLAEFDFRYSNRQALGCDDEMRMERALCGISGKRLTYAELTNGADEKKTEIPAHGAD
ncbi:IS1595 family transposase [Ferrovibrio sp.]|uniref:IS1595 family transposase n=1 Tax=Ferrovibrio sp. TaxID=1917215 RepID=UPI000CA9A6D0|nr:IS1595 family transposase [Ferrovibrio sp.]PJI37386.1 MAG: IS1595 family transposase [Ferrovibrio sp.]